MWEKENCVLMLSVHVFILCSPLHTQQESKNIYIHVFTLLVASFSDKFWDASIKAFAIPSLTI